MEQGNRSGRIDRRLIALLAALTLALLLLSACTGSSTGSTNNGSASSQSPTSTACDQMLRVTISEHTTSSDTDQYFFTPDHITIKAGEFVLFSNQSDEVHALVTTPGDVLVNSVIDRNEDQPVQFTRAGSYTLESQNAAHRATMHVTVIPTTGTTCGMSTPGTTVTFMEKRVQGQTDLYALTPKAVSLSAGQSLTLVNKSDQAFNFICKPSADLTEGNLRVDTDEQQVVQFVKTGQYTCTTTTSPMTRVTVMVH